MSGLSRTPGKRVRVNSPPRVRIPLPPPVPSEALQRHDQWLWLGSGQRLMRWPHVRMLANFEAALQVR